MKIKDIYGNDCINGKFDRGFVQKLYSVVHSNDKGEHTTELNFIDEGTLKLSIYTQNVGNITV